MAYSLIPSSMVLLLSGFLLFTYAAVSDTTGGFLFNGFVGTNLSLHDLAVITQSGLLALTNGTVHHKGYAFFPFPFHILDSHGGHPNSFSTSFVFAITSENPNRLSRHGIAFIVSHSQILYGGPTSQYLGIFNASNNSNAASNHVIAVELNTIQSSKVDDIHDNHVGISCNGQVLNESHTAGYYTTDETGATTFTKINLNIGKPTTVSVDYTGESSRLEVTLSPTYVSERPSRPLLSATVNVSDVVGDSIFVGFSSSTGSVVSAHYILGWSFRMNGKAEQLHLSDLPLVPVDDSKGKLDARSIWVPLSIAAALLLFITAAVGAARWRMIKYADVLEDWEHDFRLRRFRYRELYVAARGFREKGLLGYGGFGRVYRGILPDSKEEVAIKKVVHDESTDGVKGFIAEIASIGRLSHRNLVRLFGYCRRKGELLLVYEFMPNGSLDKHLFEDVESAGHLGVVDWAKRFHVVKGVASALVYLHEGWEKVVIHRDVKASNVLLDADMNARLGDFGLARLHERGSNPCSTVVVGTMGYLAPELPMTGRATTLTDVFAFGAFLLEVACGRRPIDPRGEGEEVVLVNWVAERWQRGELLGAVDPRMEGTYEAAEVEMVLRVGLLCSNTVAASRPTMREVVGFLEGELPMPEIPDGYLSVGIPGATGRELVVDSCMVPIRSSFSVETFASGLSGDCADA